MDYQKNHPFMIEVMNHLRTVDKEMVLLIIGSGPLENEVRDMVSKQQLDENVVFCGQVKDVYKYYSAMDVFVMPSYFEGLPVAAIEAQCTGVKCFVSSCITKEVKILDSMEYLEINDSLHWAKMISNYLCEIKRDLMAEQKVVKAGYSIFEESKKLELQYAKLKAQSHLE